MFIDVVEWFDQSTVVRWCLSTARAWRSICHAIRNADEIKRAKPAPSHVHKRIRASSRKKLHSRTAQAAVICLAAGLVEANAGVPEYTATIVATYPHDPHAFTEGLLYHKGHLYESTGRTGQSSIRAVDLKTGYVVSHADLGPEYFGEGIVIWKNELIQLTWKTGIGFVRDLKTFALLSTFHYPGEGWALTRNSTNLIMSDGTSDLRVLDPGTLNERRRIRVTCDGHAIRNINELEWVKDEIYANIWRSNVIVRIDPRTGGVVGMVDLTDLVNSTVKVSGDNVLNGIAFDAAGNRLFVTGKYWPALYQIKLSRRSAEANLCRTLPLAGS